MDSYVTIMNEAEKKTLEGMLDSLERTEIKGVSIDSRNIREGELFVAIKGDRFDGHDFVPDAIKKGAWGALVERSTLEKKFERLGGLKNIMPVEDTLFALQEMSFMHRKKFDIPVVGITGSNGKTTTKEMLAGILKRKGPVLKNEGNLNNHIGVPLTLLKLDATHKTAVIEMGMSGLGEIDMLARLVSPNVAVITNIGAAHLEFLGSLEHVARAKGELLDNLRSDGTAVLNVDDKYFKTLKGKFSGRVVTFGIDHKANFQASDIRQEKDLTDFSITADGQRVDVRLRLVGRHNIYNALAATAAAMTLGMSIEAVKYGLEAFVPVAMRSELRQVHGRTIFADCYNANPGSMEAALATLISLKAGGKTVAVLGDMLELGASAAEAHRALGATVSRLKVDVLIIAGPLAKHISEGAREAGMPKDTVHEAQSNSEATVLLREHSQNGDVVLIKGSRGMKMETILEEF